jgi:hypothetical protein
MLEAESTFVPISTHRAGTNRYGDVENLRYSQINVMKNVVPLSTERGGKLNQSLVFAPNTKFLEVGTEFNKESRASIHAPVGPRKVVKMPNKATSFKRRVSSIKSSDSGLNLETTGVRDRAESDTLIPIIIT